MNRQALKGLTLTVMLVTSVLAQAQTADSLYYDIGGAAPFGASAGLGHGPRAQGLGKPKANTRSNVVPRATRAGAGGRLGRQRQLR